MIYKNSDFSKNNQKKQHFFVKKAPKALPSSLSGGNGHTANLKDKRIGEDAEESW